MSTTRLLTGSLLLSAFLACGGGGGGSSSSSSTTPPPTPTATSLSYTDPTGTGWRFVKDASSTSTHLVLNLVGPSAGSGHGIAFTVSADASKATWSKVVSGDPEYVRNVAYNLGTGSQFFKSKVATGALSAGVFQKGVSGAAATYSGPLVRVAIDLMPGNAIGTSIPLTVTGSQELTASGMGAVTIATGTLVAQ